MKKINSGVSLITLIITIVAIIILASVALITGLNAPKSAAYSKFCNDISQIQDAVTIKYISEYEEKFDNTEELSKEFVYQGILKENGKVETIGGITVNEIDGSKIDYDLPQYTDSHGNPQTWYVDINTDTVYLLPGYEYQGKIYVTETKDKGSVQNTVVPVKNSVTISGVLTVGEVLSANLKNTPSASSRVTYNWWYTTVKGSTRGTAIPGAISSRYTIEGSMERKYIGVTVNVVSQDGVTTEYTGITSSLIGGERDYLIKPTVTGNYVYNGENQNVKLNNFDSTTMNITGQTGKDAGSYTAVVSIKRPFVYEWETEDTEDVNLTWVIEQKDGSTLSLSGVESSYTYTGNQIKPTVVMWNNTEKLVEGRDYDVVYGSNTNITDQGTISITFKGNYKGTRTETFAIVKDNVSEERIGISGVESGYIYSGKAINPVPTVTVDGKPVIAGTDYDVTYGNNKDVGQGSVTITFKGNYSGSKVVTFDITKRIVSSDGITINNVEAAYEYTTSQIKPTPEVIVDDIKLNQGTDYDVTYGDNLIVGKGTVKVTLKGNYEGSREIEFRIDPKASNESNTVINNLNTTYDYTGSQIKPEVVVVVAEKRLTAGQDYDVTYGDNLNVGSGSLVVTFKGNYTGVITKTFGIIPMYATESEIIVTNVNAVYEYIGEAIAPTPIVTVKNVELTNEKDYRVTYADNTNQGKGKVIIKLQNNYSGDKIVEFEIKPQQVNEGSIVISGVENSYAYTGSQIKPVPVVEVDGVELTDGKDYDVSYGDNLNKGTGTIIITFKGNYIGSTQKTFEIAIKSVSSSEITINGVDASYEYKGSQITPEIEVVVDGKTLTTNDYTVEYGTNLDVGDGSVKVTLKNNYEGSKESTFAITAKVVTATVTAGTTTFNYNGLEQKPTVTVSGAVENETINLNISTTPTPSIEAGSYTADVTIGSVTNGIASNYTLTGDTTINFTIAPKNISSVTMTLDISEYTFDGTAKTPGVTVTDPVLGGLTEGTHYQLTHANNTNVGNQAKAIITGIGNYTGTKTVTFTIASAEMVIVAENTSETYDGTAHSANISVTTPVTGATIWYKEGTELTVENYDTVGSKEVPIRTDVGNSQIYYYVVADNYNDKSGSVNILVNARQITVKAKDATKKYDGEPLTSNTVEVTSAIQLADGHKIGTVKTNGTVTNVDSVTNEITEITILDASNNDVTSNYAITKVPGTLTVTAKDAVEFTVTLSEYTYEYDGTAKTPAVASVKDGTKTVDSSQYTVSCSNNIDAGTATVTVTGKENYAGSTGSTTFKITEKALTLTAGSNSKTYDGSALTVSTVSSSGLVNGHTLSATTEGSQTNVGSSNNTVKTYSVKSGSTDVTKNYAITLKTGTLTVNKKTVTVTKGTVTFNYDGTAKKPTATVSGVAAGETINLIITTNPASAINPGTHSATVTIGSVTNGSTSNYTLTGDTSISFTIKARITFAANGGGGSMSNQYVTLNSSYTLPTCTFTTPSGKKFDGWSVGSTTYAAGSRITISGNTTVTAQWKSSGLTNPEGGTVSILGNNEINNSNYKNNTNISMVVQAPGETIQVPIPTGFTYYLGTGNTGLVVKDAKDNEFVWIPVSDVTKMYETGTAVSMTYQDVNYSVTTTQWGKSVLGKTMKAPNESGYREPAILTGFGSSDYDAISSNYKKAGFNSLELFATDLKNEFDSMINSVGKYGGFYVGRYELGYSGGVVCKPSVKVLTAADSSGTNYYGSSTYSSWYGLYKASKLFTQGGVQSSMIWGCQWDAMVNFIGDHEMESLEIYTRYLTGKYEDEYKHVHDTSNGAVYDWTATAEGCSKGNNSSDCRVGRGGYYYKSELSSSRGTNGYPGYEWEDYGTRVQIYIK